VTRWEIAWRAGEKGNAKRLGRREARPVHGAPHDRGDGRPGDQGFGQGKPRAVRGEAGETGAEGGPVGGGREVIQGGRDRVGRDGTRPVPRFGRLADAPAGKFDAWKVRQSTRDVVNRLGGWTPPNGGRPTAGQGSPLRMNTERCGRESENDSVQNEGDEWGTDHGPRQWGEPTQMGVPMPKPGQHRPRLQLAACTRPTSTSHLSGIGTDGLRHSQYWRARGVRRRASRRPSAKTIRRASLLPLPP
jgi:hypothetical protein